MAEIDHEKLKAMVENAVDLTTTARDLSERDRDYYDGHQWTAEEQRILQSRRQPVVTINRIKRKVDAMIGIEQRSRTDPRALGRTPNDEQGAEVATAALVYVDDNTRFDAKKSSAFENLLVEGYGGVEVGVEERRGKLEITIERLRWEEIFYDPHSREKDFSDAGYMGVMKWMTLDQAMEQHSPLWQGEPKELETLLSASMVNAQDETYGDRPDNQSFQWGDKRKRRVRVSQMYYRNRGVWYLSIFCGGGEILNQPSPYLDEDGKPSNPMILFSAYVDRENRRYGVVRDMISAQDEINKRRAKLLHQLNARQTMGERGAVNVEEMKREMASPDGHVEYDPGADGRPGFQVIPATDQVGGQFNLLTEAKGEIDMTGPNASLVGQVQGEQSGRAIMAQQQAGLVELSPVYDSLRDWTLRVYRTIWERIRQFWTEERYVRITDDLQAPQYIGLNVVQGMDPMTGQPVMENAVPDMDVDIIIEESPDYATLRQEEFQQLAELAQSGLPIPPQMLIEASNVRNKREILQQMQEAQQGQQAMQQQAQQVDTAERMADVEAKRAKAMKDMIAAQVEQATARGEIEESRAQAFRDFAAGQRDLAEIARMAADIGLSSQSLPPGVNGRF